MGEAGPLRPLSFRSPSLRPLTYPFGVALLAAALLTAPARADVKLPSIIGSDMVLQRGQPCPIWGWADPGERVTVEFAGQRRSTTAGPDGRWFLELRPMRKSAEGRTLTVRGKNTLTLGNVLVGEVWFCSGQSNMEWTVGQSDRAQEEIAAANHPLIRHIKIPHRPSTQEEEDVPSEGWKVCSPQTVGSFTAVGYFFGREIMKELDVPVGLIGCNWGGTRIEPWIPPTGFEQVPALSDITSKLSTFPTRTFALDPRNPGRVVRSINFQTPLALWNGMVHPLVPFAIRGALWYQGESNNGEGPLYLEKMKALIQGWRTVWGKPDMPFYFVQLAPFRYGGDPTRLPGIWDAQRRALEIPHTGMAVTTDIGNVADIHPRNKQEVGRRLALWALERTYDREVKEISGPLFAGVSRRGDRLVVRFKHTGSGLTTRDGKAPSHFEIAAKDGPFVPATAVIEGKTVIVSSPQIKKPARVRFGWNETAEPNFGNKDGLPASPFQSD